MEHSVMRARSSFEIIEPFAREIFQLRFQQKVARGEPDDCWLWQGNISASGYGMVVIKKGRNAVAHRIAYELATGPIPSGMMVCHHCESRYPYGDRTSRRCVNPAHLYLGTARDNMLEMFRLGRRHTIAPRGSLHPHHKLTEETAREIRALKGIMHYREVMARYGVGQSTIYRVWDDDCPTWGHIK